ncbi:MAG: hypothetical protein ACOC44_19730 [Promethearchaeia archaeon]
MKHCNLQNLPRKKEIIAKTVVKKLKTNRWDKNLVRNLDDYVPSLSYIDPKYEKFLLDKVVSLIVNSEYISQGFHCRERNNIFWSWNNDEWLGGLNLLQKNNNSQKIDNEIQTFVDNFPKAFVRDDKICSFSFLIKGKWYPYPTFNPRCGGIIEEVADLSKDIGSVLNWEKLLKKSFDNKHFKEKSIFPNQTFFGKLSGFNKLTELPHITKLGNFINKIAYADIAPTKKVYQPAKNNSALLHATITGYKYSKSSFLKSKLNKFIDGISKHFVNDEGFVRVKSLDKSEENFNLAINHPIIDGLCDAYYFVEKDNNFLRLAEKIAQAWIRQRLSTGLFPRSPRDDFSWLDDQIDLAITFGRLYELTGIKRYLKISKETIKFVFEKHYSLSKKGLVEKVDKNGNVIDPTVHPKYNSLAIKAFIFIEKVLEGDEKIYSSESKVHDMLKDR